MDNLTDRCVVGQSEVMQQVKHTIKINAQYTAPVLITGETGTGKELAARGLHYDGPLADKPFITINCSTFSDDLFASELFGHKKGAFTDAKKDKDGLLVAANGGSIFLDEIDSLSLKSQAALLRLLQESEFRPVGSNETIKANVRFIAAANCDLNEKIKTGEFRQDLYFRLFILSVYIPPLRERMDDLFALVKHFILKFNQQYGLNKESITDSLAKKLSQHRWPGNVRELENTIHRYYLLAAGKMLDCSAVVDMNLQSSGSNTAHTSEHSGESNIYHSADADTQPQESTSTNFSFVDEKKKAIERFEQNFVLRMMKFTKGNISKAAMLCGKERRAFGKLVKKYDTKSTLQVSSSV